MKTKIVTLLGAGLSLLVTFGAAAQTDQDPPILFSQIIPDQYIAVFKPGTPDPHAAAQALANQHGVGLNLVYQHSIRGFAFSGNAQAAQALARNPRIAYVEPDQICQAWEAQLPTGIQRVGIDRTVLSVISPQGQNVPATIAVIDTGLQRDHPDLNVDPNGIRFYVGRGHKILSDGNFDDDNGHGTHCAGIAAANGAIVGVAPGALLTAVKVLGSDGSGPYSGVIAGVDWVAANAANFDVANMSLGGGFSQAMNDAVKAATEAGVVFCVSAGNSAANVENYSPASAPEAITVSAMVDRDGLPGGLSTASSSCSPDDFFACFSNFGSGVDTCAPGYLIYSTFINSGYATGSGTSMAAPHVTGAAALYIAAHRDVLSAMSGAERVAYVTQALTSSGWMAQDLGYFWGDEDGFAEPLLDVPSLLGLATRPQINVSITAPTDGSTFDLGDSITFAASGSSSDATYPLFWAWRSSLDGLVGDSQSFSTAALSEGAHTIVAYYTQEGTWFSGAATIFVAVGDTNPKPLVLSLTTDKTTYVDGDTMISYYHTTDGTDGSPVPDVTIDAILTDAKGNHYTLHSSTDENGYRAAFFHIDFQTNGRGTYTIDATATKTGYVDAEASTSFEVKKH